MQPAIVPCVLLAIFGLYVSTEDMPNLSPKLRFAIYLVCLTIAASGAFIILISNPPIELANSKDPALIPSVLYISVLLAWALAQTNVSELNQVRAYVIGILVCGPILAIAFWRMRALVDIELGGIGTIAAAGLAGVVGAAFQLGAAVLVIRAIERMFSIQSN